MKVLLLHPQIQSLGDPLPKGLQVKGMAVLLAANPTEAAQILSLHGSNLDLAIVHREDASGKNTDLGLQFVAKIKTSQQHADLPLIVTSRFWGDADFAKHQESQFGANAYLKWPTDAETVHSIILAVFGGSLPSSDVSRNVTSPSIPTASGVTGGTQGTVLEDVSNLFGLNAMKEKSDTSIKLDLPEFASDEASAGEAVSQNSASPPVAELPSVELSIALPAEMEVPLPSPPAASEALAQVLAQDEAAEVILDSLPTTSNGASEGASANSRRDSRASVQESVRDEQVAQEMPYLYDTPPRAEPVVSAPVAFALPLGDAVVPGGAAHAPDVETLKKYLLLREQDVAVLSTQLRAAQAQIKSLEDKLREERGRNTELGHVTQEQKRRIDDFERVQRQSQDTATSELSELRFQLKARADKARLLEGQVREAADEMERLKDRVRSDIRKIRVREKELENRLEIMKKDSEALISARENKIIELKRKVDLLEFNMDLLQDQHAREKDNAVKLRERLARAAQVVRVAGGLLDNPAGASQLAAALAESDGAPTGDLAKSPNSKDVA